MKVYYAIILLFISINSSAQNKPLISGPWAGNVQIKTATIWAEVNSTVKKVAVQYYLTNNAAVKKTIAYKGELGKDFNPVKIELTGLEMNSKYNYQLIIDDKVITTAFPTTFTTQELWQFRKPEPDFSFLAGSCFYVNEPSVDRPGKPYGEDSSIFETMAKTPGAFHIWMGDNWYAREVDFGSPWGLNYRASRDRSQSVIQKFMASMPQYSIWDDHDYGPNDAGKSYIFKDESRNIFKNYSVNPSYGEDGKGIYTQFAFSDVDVFLTDDRYFRSHDEMKDTLDALGNPTKQFLGGQQLEWLKNSLLFSKATFKIVVVGSQVLNPLNAYECMRNYEYEYKELMRFLDDSKVPGVVFFTGDRHHSEVIKLDRPGIYPLYDVTASSYTAGVSKASGKEADNPFRVNNTLVEENNFARISVSGAARKRVLKVEFINKEGVVRGSCEIEGADLRAK